MRGRLFLVLLVGLLLVAGSVGAAGYPRSHVAELADPAAENADQFGFSVAIDGDVIVVGAPYDDGAGINRGAVHVFVRGTGGWAHGWELTDPEAADGDLLGHAVALDGGTIVAGAPYDDGPGTNRGAVHVFVRVRGGWDHLDTVLTDPSPNDHAKLGWSVAIDGDTVVAGAPHDGGAGAIRGAAHVFRRDAGVWSYVKELTDPNAADGDDLGWSVAIDGDTIAAGARYDAGAGHQRGAVHVFRPGVGGWLHFDELTHPNAENNDEFGFSVAVDGDVIAVGAPLDDGGVTDRGAVHVFRRDAGEWSYLEELTHPDFAQSDVLGWSVVIDGDTIVAGARLDDGGGTSRGAAHLFVRDSGTGDWSHLQGLTDPSAADGDEFGRAVAVDGDTIVAGALFDDGDGADRGAVHVFADDTGPTVTITTPANGATYAQGAPLVADYSCSDAGSGIVSCVGTVADGTPIPSGSLGAFTFTVSATDGVGNATSVTSSYAVVAACDGKPATHVVPTGAVPFEGTPGDDVILGTPGPDVISGKGGDDTICGGAGDDILLGGPGADTLLGGDGNDRLRGAAGDDTLRGGAGSDRLLPESGDDVVNGGAGSDIVDYLAAAGPVSVDLPAGTATYSPVGGSTWSHSLVLVEKVDGSPFGDTLIGDGKRNVLRGKHGADTIEGGGGDDALIGGLDGDEVSGGDGNDLVKGQGDDDVLGGGGGNDRMVGGSGNDSLDGGPGDDTLIGGLKSHLGSSVNTLDGGPGTDTCRWDTPTIDCP
jgi:Ca2+-binding RTX toxin-like protein